MSRNSLLLVLALLASTVAPAHAAGKVTATAGLLSGNASTSICCVVNLDDESVQVPIEIVSFAGVVGVSANATIPAAGMQCIDDSTPTISYCRVGAAPKNIRVSFCMADSNNNCMAAVTAPGK